MPDELSGYETVTEEQAAEEQEERESRGVGTGDIERAFEGIEKYTEEVEDLEEERFKGQLTDIESLARRIGYTKDTMLKDSEVEEFQKLGLKDPEFELKVLGSMYQGRTANLNSVVSGMSEVEIRDNLLHRGFSQELIDKMIEKAPPGSVRYGAQGEMIPSRFVGNQEFTNSSWQRKWEEYQTTGLLPEGLRSWEELYNYAFTNPDYRNAGSPLIDYPFVIDLMTKNGSLAVFNKAGFMPEDLLFTGFDREGYPTFRDKEGDGYSIGKNGEIVGGDRWWNRESGTYEGSAEARLKSAGVANGVNYIPTIDGIELDYGGGVKRFMTNEELKANNYDPAKMRRSYNAFEVYESSPTHENFIKYLVASDVKPEDWYSANPPPAWWLNPTAPEDSVMSQADVKEFLARASKQDFAPVLMPDRTPSIPVLSAAWKAFEWAIPKAIDFFETTNKISKDTGANFLADILAFTKLSPDKETAKKAIEQNPVILDVVNAFLPGQLIAGNVAANSAMEITEAISGSTFWLNYGLTAKYMGTGVEYLMDKYNPDTGSYEKTTQTRIQAAEKIFEQIENGDLQGALADAKRKYNELTTAGERLGLDLYVQWLILRNAPLAIKTTQQLVAQTRLKWAETAFNKAQASIIAEGAGRRESLNFAASKYADMLAARSNLTRSANELRLLRTLPEDKLAFKALGNEAIKTSVARTNAAREAMLAHQEGRLTPEIKATAMESHRAALEAKRRFDSMDLYLKTTYNKNFSSAYQGIPFLGKVEISDIPRFIDAIPGMYRTDRWTQLMAWATKYPAVKQLAETIDPKNTGAISLINQGVFMYRLQVAKSQTYLAIHSAKLFAAEDMFTYSWLKSVMGGWLGVAPNVKNVKHIGSATVAAGSHSTDVNRVMQFPKEYEFISGNFKGKTIEQHPLYQEQKVFWQEIKDLLKKHDINIRELQLADDEEYAHRGVVKGIDTLISHFKEHRTTLDIDDAKKLGIRYSNDWKNNLIKASQDAYELIIRNRFAEYMVDKGLLTETPKEISQLRTLSNAFMSDLKNARKLIIGKKDTLNTLTADELDRIKTALPEAYDLIKQNKAFDEINTVLGEAMRDAMFVVKKAKEPAKLVGKASLPEKVRDTIVNGDTMKALQKRLNKSDWAKGMGQIDKEVAEGIYSAWGGKVPGFLKAFEAPNQIGRFSITGIDFGVPFTLGTPVLFTKPDIWAKSWTSMIKALASPKYLNKLVAKNEQVLKIMAEQGDMLFDTPEFMQGAGLLGKVPGLNLITQAFSRTFTGALDYSRLELFKAHYRPGMSQSEIKSVANYVDKLCGTLSNVAMGISPTRSAIESILLFAPRYTRSVHALMADALRPGGFRGFRALQAYASLEVGQTLLHVVSAGLLGQPVRLNPSEPYFRQVQIDNVWIGVFSAIKAMDRLEGRALASILQGRFDKLLPMTGRYFESKRSPGFALVTDFLRNSNYIGESMVENSILSVANDFLSNKEVTMEQLGLATEKSARYITMAWLNAAFHELRDVPNVTTFDRLVAGIGTFLGLGTTPGLASSDLSVERNQYARGIYNEDLGRNYRDWDDLRTNGRIEDEAYINNQPHIKELRRRAEEERVSKGPTGWEAAEFDWHEFAPERTRLERSKNERLNSIAGQLSEGIISQKQFDAEYKEINETYSKSIKELKDKYPAVDDMVYTSSPRGNLSYERQAFLAYLDIGVYDKSLYKEQDVDKYYTALVRAKQNYLDKGWTEKDWQNSKELYLMSKDLHPYIIYKRMTSELVGLTRDSKFNDMSYWQIPRGTDADREKINQFLWDHPDIEARLYVTGDLFTIQTLEAYNIAKQDIETLGLKMGVPLPIDRRDVGERDRAWEQYQREKGNISKKDFSYEEKKYDTELWRAYYDIKSKAEGMQFAITETQQQKIMSELYDQLDKWMILKNDVQQFPSEYFKSTVDAIELELKYRVSNIYSLYLKELELMK